MSAKGEVKRIYNVITRTYNETGGSALVMAHTIVVNKFNSFIVYLKEEQANIY